MKETRKDRCYILLDLHDSDGSSMAERNTNLNTQYTEESDPHSHCGIQKNQIPTAITVSMGPVAAEAKGTWAVLQRT